jgi:hypothetical protein
VLTLMVPSKVLERIRRIAGSITSTDIRGSPSQPWPKLTTAAFTLRMW